MAETHRSVPNPIHPGRPEGVLPPEPDVNGRRILWTLLALIVASVLAFLAVTWLINLWIVLTPNFLIPDNIRQLNVQVTSESIENRRQFQQTELEALQNYRVLNPQQGTVAIPIDRAKELILQRGLPARSENVRPQIEGELDEPDGERSGYTLQEAQRRLGPGIQTAGGGGTGSSGG